MGTGRLEAFSDGVIAVAITLLALEISVPEVEHGRHLAHALGAQWPQYAAYVVSFLTIGILWINHHNTTGWLREIDHSVLIVNTLLLMTICLLPFTTELMAHYLRSGDGEGVAAAVYAGSFALMGIAFSALDVLILIGRPDLLREPLGLAARRRMLRAAIYGVLPYLLAVGLAFVSPYLTLGLCAAVTASYALPRAAATVTDEPR